MVDFGKLLLGKEKEEEEEKEEEGALEEGGEEEIDSIISGADGEVGAEDEGAIGGGGPQGGGGMGVAPDIRDDIDSNREEIREIEANVETMEDTVEDIDERVKDIEEDISQLLDVYEMVTAEFNPFLDEDDALSTGGTGGMAGEEEEEEEEWGLEEAEEEPEEDSLYEVIRPPDEAEEESEEEMPDLGEPEEPVKTETTQPDLEETPGTGEIEEPEEPVEAETAQPDLKEAPETRSREMESTKQSFEEKEGVGLEKLLDELTYGNTYLLKTTDEDFVYEAFESIVDGESGLCITRKHPDDIKEKYDYGDKNIEFGWLSTSNEEIAIAPDELDILGLTVERFISDEGGIILLDGVNYLLSNNPDSTLIHFMQSLQDQIAVGETMFLIAVDPSNIEEKNLDLLKNELDVEVKEKKKFTPHPEKKEREPVQRGISRRRKEENLVAKVKRMMDFLDEQERALERKIDQVSRTSSVNVSDKVASPGVLDAIEGLEKEIKMLANELKTLKERQMIEKTTEKDRSSPEETPEEKELDEFVEMVERGEELQEELEDIKEEIKGDEDVVEEEGEAEIVKKKVIPPEKQKDIMIDETEDEEEVEKIVHKDSVVPAEEEKSAIYTENEVKLQAEVSGDIASGSGVEIQKDVSVKGSLTAEGDIVLHDRATVEGDVISRAGNVKVGKNCTINGKISGNTVHISDNSEAQVIDAKKDVFLGRSAHARKVSGGGDIKLSEKVQIKDGIEYGGRLIFEGSEIAVGDLINPFGEKKKEEVVKERWASR